ncbi:sulfurtransferase TusA family protein [Inmirania thermothiophila]|uniref:TusA-related sulfurtransferase n=1 Tax=Inmirania thermothiophila TaxID=1750597 RepID=A0A3N1Y602_9GAMM|nr:sulfurtransferase TusA family protein [Inmirania thermothiophila]ROR32727.1 TusA-related sulfurtransferase [Inmirania thermothiophila]
MERHGEHKADVTVDLSGVVCPGPLPAAKRIAEELEPGQVMLLVSDCPGVEDDLRAWARHTGNRLLHVEGLAEGRRGYYVQKARRWPVAVRLDMRGARCPGPVVEARRVLEGMGEGEIMELVSTCPGTPEDVRAWTANTGHELLEAVRDAEGAHHFFIRK